MSQILEYHSLALMPTYHIVVRENADFVYSTTEQQIDSHLQRLASLRSVGHGKAESTSVTFDDGHASQYRYALPLLEKHRVRAIFFSVASWIDQRSDYMSSAQLRELVSLGHEVQSHGLSHCMLPQCSEAKLREELVRSRSELEQRLGVGVEAISIPFGRWNPLVLKACAVAGYKRIYTSDLCPLNVPAGHAEVSGRFMVRRSTNAQDIERMVTAKRSLLLFMQAFEESKKLVRATLGENLYHHLWGIVASRKMLDDARSEYEPRPEQR